MPATGRRAGDYYITSTLQDGVQAEPGMPWIQALSTTAHTQNTESGTRYPLHFRIRIFSLKSISCYAHIYLTFTRYALFTQCVCVFCSVLTMEITYFPEHYSPVASVMETQSVFCEVRTKFINLIYITFRLQSVKTHWRPTSRVGEESATKSLHLSLPCHSSLPPSPKAFTIILGDAVLLFPSWSRPSAWAFSFRFYVQAPVLYSVFVAKLDHSILFC